MAEPRTQSARLDELGCPYGHPNACGLRQFRGQGSPPSGARGAEPPVSTTAYGAPRPVRSLRRVGDAEGTLAGRGPRRRAATFPFAVVPRSPGPVMFAAGFVGRDVSRGWPVPLRSGAVEQGHEAVVPVQLLVAVQRETGLAGDEAEVEISGSRRARRR